MEIDSSNMITLRPFKLSDVDDFMKWAGDDQVMRPLRWNTFTSKEEALTYIKDACIPHPWRRSICIRDRSIGFVSIYTGSGDDRCRADIGYAVAVQFWSKGIATKAVKIAVSEVFKDFPEVIRLQAHVDVQNKASQRVLEKVGFLQEGLLRKYSYIKGQIKDLYVYSFLSTDSSDTLTGMLKPVEINLRPFKNSDVDDFMTWAGDDNVTKYCQWNTFTSKVDAMDFLQEVIKSHPWYRAICIGDCPVGSIYVLPGTGEDQRRGQIGYAVSAKYWSKGIATEAVKMAIGCVSKELKCLDSVEGLVIDENIASQRVLEKAGFVRDGVRKNILVKGKNWDLIVFSIVKSN